MPGQNRNHLQKVPPELLESGEWFGDGFKPILEIENFRVAVLRYFEGVSKENVSRIERHNETDEIFILIDGDASMALFVNNSLDNGPLIFNLKKNKVYNVKKGAWHQVFLSRDAHIIIFEKSDTGKDNSSYHVPDEKLKGSILSSLRNI